MKKKIIIVLLILGVSSGAFGQLSVGLSADLFPELFRYTVPGGDFADKDNASVYRGTGTLDFLSTSSEEILSKPNEVRLALNYAGKSFAAYVQVAYDDYFRTSWNGGSGNGAFMDGGAMDASFYTLMNQIFNEWFVRGTAGILTAYVGKTNDRGKVARFQLGFDDLIYSLRLDNYSVITPDSASGKVWLFNSLNGIDNNNFLRQMQTEGKYRRYNQPYFSLSANVRPFTFQVAGDLGNSSGVNPAIPGQSYIKMNGAVRVSGERIANRVTFDAIYKFRGGDQNTLDSIAAPQPDGDGVTVHSMGLYANILGLPLGIGLGYTGLFRVYKDRDSSYGEWESKTVPFFSGIDLRLQYTGIDRLTITTHNNLSFAMTNGSGDPKKPVMPVNGETLPLPPDTGENWLAVFNALSFNYSLSRQLTVGLQVANRLGSYTRDWRGFKDKESRDLFAAVAAVSYQFNPSVLLQGGLQFFVDSTVNTYETPGTIAAPNVDVNGNTVYIAIPLHLLINF
jgi:hypothetical protein